MGAIVITWLVRYGHIVGGGLWLGGYALLAIVIIPLLEKQANSLLATAAVATTRLLTYAGTATIVFGLVLISRSRGFAAFSSGGEWGGIIMTCIVIAIGLMGLGDGALRPALKQLAETGDGRWARRFAWTGFILTVIAIGLMTRALYAGS
jgi:hypothetical protein